MKSFVNRLKVWREREKLTQAAAAQLLGVSRTYLNLLENGERVASSKIVNKLLQIDPIAGATPREKLTDALKKYGFTTAALAKEIGYSPGVIDNVVNGAGRASEKMLNAIVQEIPELTKDDLMNGGDDVPVVGGGSTHGIHGQTPNVILPDGVTGRMVPLLSMAQAGGWDAGHSDEGWSGAAVFALNVDDYQAFAIKVSGNSMEPEISEGDIVICSPRVVLTQGCCAVVRTKSDAAFIKFWKRKGDTVILESANSGYAPIKFPAAEIAGAWPVVQKISSGMIKKQ